jgi:hypothetical protein
MGDTESELGFGTMNNAATDTPLGRTTTVPTAHELQAHWGDIAPLQGSRVGSRPHAAQLLTQCRLRHPPSIFSFNGCLRQRYRPHPQVRTLLRHPTTHRRQHDQDCQVLPHQRDLAADHRPRCSSALKVTMPTGIQVAAANIHHGPRCGSVADI